MYETISSSLCYYLGVGPKPPGNIAMNFLLTLADGIFRVFSEFKIIFLIKENQNLDDMTI